MTTPTTSRVSDAAKELIRLVKKQAGGYTTGPGYEAFAAACALEAALASQGDVVAVSEIQKVIDRWDSGQYGPGQVVEALRNLNRGGR